MLRLSRAAAVALTCCASMLTAQEVTTVGTMSTPAFTQAGVYMNQLDGNASTFGQTFRTPDELNKYLLSWTFSGNYLPGSGYGLLSFRLDIVEYLGVTGTDLLNPLYSSATRSFESETSEDITFAMNLKLDPTRVYLAFLRPVGVEPLPGGLPYSQDAIDVHCVFAEACGYATSEDYVAGNVVGISATYNANTGMYGGFESAQIVDYGNTYDARFEAQFTTTPEPGTMTLLATGLAGLAGAARRRKKKAQ